MLTSADDETDMKKLEENVRSVNKDGLVWGASKLVAVGYGVKKLQINLVVEDEKISIDELQEELAEDEDHVQSSDVVSLILPRSRQTLTDFHRLPCKSCRWIKRFKVLEESLWPVCRDLCSMAVAYLSSSSSSIDIISMIARPSNLSYMTA